MDPMPFPSTSVSSERTETASQESAWTFEQLAEMLQKAKRFLHLVKLESTSNLGSIRVGIRQSEVKFHTEIMQKYTRYFFMLAVPTTCGADQFQQDTWKLLILKEKEVQALKFAIQCCCTWGLVGPQTAKEIYQQEQDFTFEHWVRIYYIADILGAPVLQGCIAHVILLKMVDMGRPPSSETIKYFSFHRPYKDSLLSDFLYMLFVSRYAFKLEGNEMDDHPEKFGKDFIAAVEALRRNTTCLSSPGGSTASVEPRIGEGGARADDSNRARGAILNGISGEQKETSEDVIMTDSETPLDNCEKPSEEILHDSHDRPPSRNGIGITNGAQTGSVNGAHQTIGNVTCAASSNAPHTTLTKDRNGTFPISDDEMRYDCNPPFLPKESGKGLTEQSLGDPRLQSHRMPLGTTTGNGRSSLQEMRLARFGLRLGTYPTVRDTEASNGTETATVNNSQEEGIVNGSHEQHLNGTHGESANGTHEVPKRRRISIDDILNH